MSNLLKSFKKQSTFIKVAILVVIGVLVIFVCKVGASFYQEKFNKPPIPCGCLEAPTS